MVEKELLIFLIVHNLLRWLMIDAAPERRRELGAHQFLREPWTASVSGTVASVSTRPIQNAMPKSGLSFGLICWILWRPICSLKRPGRRETAGCDKKAQ